MAAEAHLEADTGLHLGFSDGIANSDAAFPVNPDGLLDNQVLPGLGGGDCLLRVERMGRTNINNIDRVIGEQVVKIRGDRERRPELGTQRGGI